MMSGVHRIRKPSGKVFKYHRKSGKPLPADIPENHPDFIAAWQQAETGGQQRKSRKTPGSIAWGCETYLASGDYLDLSDGYRPVIRRHVDAIKTQCEAATPTPMLRDLDASAIRADLSPLRPTVAASRLKAWRKLTAFWFESGATHNNASDGVRRKPIPKSDGHTPWQAADLKKFRKHWPIGTPQRLAFELLQWTGVRCVDLVRLGPQMIDRDGLLTFRQQKTGAAAHVPWSGDAWGLSSQMTDLITCIAGCNDLLFVQTMHGKARSAKSVSGWFSQAASDAGLPHLSAHGLRKYRMNEMAEAGVPLLAMQSWVGHITLDEVQEYTQKADRRRVHLIYSNSRKKYD
ncbi:tyrosine-type recombinase/integrase [Yoonia sp. 208BN28-4]